MAAAAPADDAAHPAGVAYTGRHYIGGLARPQAWNSAGNGRHEEPPNVAGTRNAGPHTAEEPAVRPAPPTASDSPADAHRRT